MERNVVTFCRSVWSMSLCCFIVLVLCFHHCTASGANFGWKRKSRATNAGKRAAAGEIGLDTGGSPPEGPIFTTEFSNDITFLNTKGVVVSCSSFGRPIPEVDWVYARPSSGLGATGGAGEQSDIVGQTIEPIPGLLDVLTNGSLYFMPFRDEMFSERNVHDVLVRCRAKNVAGTVLSKQIHVRAVLTNRYRMYKVHVNDAYVTTNNTAILQCSVEPYYVRDFIRVIAWLQSGTVLTTGNRYSIMSSGDLHIRSFGVEDSYKQYRCVTRNLLTEEEKTSDPATVIVVESVNSAPTMKDASTSVTTSRGASVELPCVAGAYPLPRYSWTKDGVPLSFSDVDDHRLKQVGGNLVLADASPADNGQYSCSAENSLGRRTVTVRLTVTEPIMVFIEPPKLTVDVGRTASFKCVITGHPIRSIRWLRDGLPLVSDNHVTLTHNETMLTVRDLERNDAGMYQCIVSNENDNGQGSAQLSSGASRPYIFNHFSSVGFTSVGPRVSLSCSASGTPTPSLRWTLDGSPIPDDARYTVSSFVTRDGDVVGHVNITSVRVQDGGQYVCVAENRIGATSFEGRLNVYGVPYVRSMNNVTIVAYTDLVLKCHVTGYPIQTVTWSKGLVQLPMNHRQFVDNNSLTIQDVNRQVDEGLYTCDARDPTGQGSSSSVYVRIIEPPKIDPFSFPSRKLGERVSITCVVSRGDPPMTLRWTKDGTDIPADLGAVEQKTGDFSSSLSIGSASPRHNGNYTCHVNNVAAATNHSARLHIDVPPQWIVEPMHKSYVVLGGSVVIDCQTSGDPTPRITWKKRSDVRKGTYESLPLLTSGGGVAGDGSGNGVRMRQFNNGSLSVQRVVEEDAGDYLCQASNGIGGDLSIVIQLTVHIPAKFIERRRNYTSVVGSNVSLDCSANGDQPLSIGWSFNQKSIDWQRNPRLHAVYSDTPTGRQSRLLIKPARREDTGLYICTSLNKFGSDASTVALTVIETPEAPSDVRVTEAGSRSVQLLWAVPYEGNTPLTGYIVQLNNASDPVSIPLVSIEVAGHEHSVFVYGLQPAVTYGVKVIAKNVLGSGQSSELITFTTDEEAPSAPPTDLEVVAISSQSLRISWKPPPAQHLNGKLIGYYVGYKKNNNTNAPYMVIQIPSRETCEIDNLEKFNQYVIRVQAYNIKGAGPASADFLALTMEDVPSRPPQGVQAFAVSSHSLMLAWSPPPLNSLNGILQGYKLVYKAVRDDEDETDAMSLTTTQLSLAIPGLRKFTNYSVQVLAFTRMGDGVMSSPLYITTLQDVPDIPTDIKTVAAGIDKILVTWKPPLHANGIITKYTLTVRDMSAQKNEETLIEVAPTLYSYMLTNLTAHCRYGCRVKASTLIGDGDSTREVTSSTVDKVSARIASFSSTLYSTSQDVVSLPCIAVGVPEPRINWKKRGVPVQSDGRSQILTNGSLIIYDVTSSDAADYTCRAENEHGADEILISLVVQGPPQQPVVRLAVTTSSSVQISWRTASNSGSRIQSFALYQKREHGDWTRTLLGAYVRSYIANSLRCGSRYLFYVSAINGIGEGQPSETIVAKTNGSAPIMPAQSLIIDHINSTYVMLALDTWQSGGCPITSFDIKYQVMEDYDWTTVDNHILPNTTLYRIDLHPATWYLVRVIAHNDAGSTECPLTFATVSYMGDPARDLPLRVLHRSSSDVQFYRKIQVMVPLFASIVILIVIAVAIGLFCRRLKQKKILAKEQNGSSNRENEDPKTKICLLSDGGGILGGGSVGLVDSLDALDKQLRADNNVSIAADDRRQRGDMRTYVAEPHRAGGMGHLSSSRGEDRNVNLLRRSFRASSRNGIQSRDLVQRLDEDVQDEDDEESVSMFRDGHNCRSPMSGGGGLSEEERGTDTSPLSDLDQNVTNRLPAAGGVSDWSVEVGGGSSIVGMVSNGGGSEFSTSDDDGNINPYATFPYRPDVTAQPHRHTTSRRRNMSGRGNTDTGPTISTNQILNASALPPPPPELLRTPNAYQNIQPGAPTNGTNCRDARNEAYYCSRNQTHLPPPPPPPVLVLGINRSTSQISGPSQYLYGGTGQQRSTRQPTNGVDQETSESCLRQQNGSKDHERLKVVPPPRHSSLFKQPDGQSNVVQGGPDLGQSIIVRGASESFSPIEDAKELTVPLNPQTLISAIHPKDVDCHTSLLHRYQMLS